MATISSLGSSGLELEGILEKLQAAEEKKLTLITARQASYETRISAYSKIQAAVEAVQKAAATLGSIDTLSAVKAVVSGDGLSVKTAAGAVPGQYTVNIDKLATAQNLQSGELDSRTDKHGTGGSIEIVQKDGTTTTVTLGEDTSLNGIVKAINGTDGLDVRATVISDGNGKHYLMLNNKTEGTEAAVTRITVSGNQEVADILDFDAANAGASNLTVQLAAQKAELTINGIPVVSDTNTVETAIDGLTLTLTKQTAAPLTVTVSSDPSVAATAVNDFVKAYNGL
ncbi:flagellar filament capping protein FliD, partial [Bordetella bronchiseptica]